MQNVTCIIVYLYSLHLGYKRSKRNYLDIRLSHTGTLNIYVARSGRVCLSPSYLLQTSWERLEEVARLPLLPGICSRSRFVPLLLLGSDTWTSQWCTIKVVLGKSFPLSSTLSMSSVLSLALGFILEKVTEVPLDVENLMLTLSDFWLGPPSERMTAVAVVPDAARSLLNAGPTLESESDSNMLDTFKCEFVQPVFRLDPDDLKDVGGKRDKKWRVFICLSHFSWRSVLSSIFLRCCNRDSTKLWFTVQSLWKAKINMSILWQSAARLDSAEPKNQVVYIIINGTDKGLFTALKNKGCLTEIVYCVEIVHHLIRFLLVWWPET